MDVTERLLASDARIAVAGAGSIGCFIGGLLTHAGRRLIFLARPHMVEELTAHGLHLTDFARLDQRLTPASLTVTDNPAALETAALILVTVKSGATDAIAGEIAVHANPHAVVVSLQNGVDNLPALRAALPEMQVLGGIVGFNVVHMGEGRFHRGTSGKLVIEAGRDDVVSLLSVPGLDIGTAEDIAGAQWGKLLLNLNNALNALSDLPLREQLQNREWRRLVADQITEALAVLKAAGIRPIAATPAPNRLLPTVLRLPDALFRLGAGQMLAIDPEARSSMWDDLMRRRPTEIGHLQGAILRLAERHGVEAPLCARVAALVRQAETAEAGPPGLTPEQVRGQVSAEP
jgi:2-dehydropantoate 2-reductase